MRYLLIAGLLLLPLIAWAQQNQTTDNSTITLTIAEYAKVVVGDIDCGTVELEEVEGGTPSGSFSGSAEITITANCEWSLTWDDSVYLSNNGDKIKADLVVLEGDEEQEKPLEGSMSASYTYKASGTVDIEDPAGTYSGTATVTLTY